MPVIADIFNVHKFRKEMTFPLNETHGFLFSWNKKSARKERLVQKVNKQ